MSATPTGRHRHGTIGLIPVRSLVRVRRSLFTWFRPGRHRAVSVGVRTPRLAPAGV